MSLEGQWHERSYAGGVLGELADAPVGESACSAVAAAVSAGSRAW